MARASRASCAPSQCHLLLAVAGAVACSVSAAPPQPCTEADGPGCMGELTTTAAMARPPDAGAANSTAGSIVATSILVSMTVRNVDCHLLTASAPLHAAFEAAIAAVLADEAGAGVAPGRVQLALSAGSAAAEGSADLLEEGGASGATGAAPAGSVAVQGSIDLPGGADARAVLARLRSSRSLSNSVSAAVGRIVGIDAVRMGMIEVGPLDVREMTAIAGKGMTNHHQTEDKANLSSEVLCSSFSCPSGTSALNLSCRSLPCTPAECCGASMHGVREVAASGAADLQTTSACSHSLGDLGTGITCWGNGSGTGFVLYSREAVHTRFGARPPEAGSAEHLACVRFQRGTWQYSSSNAWVGFTAVATDMLIAKLGFEVREVYSLLGVEGVHEEVAMGFANGDLEIKSYGWGNSSGGSGRFHVSGTFFSTTDCGGPQLGGGSSGSRSRDNADAACQLAVAGISCNLQRPVAILSAVLLGACLLCCAHRVCQVRLSKKRKMVCPKKDTNFPERSSRQDSEKRKAKSDASTSPSEVLVMVDVEHTSAMKVSVKGPQLQDAVEATALQLMLTEREAVLGERLPPLLHQCSNLLVKASWCPPLVLQVHSPNVHKACEGEYMLSSEEANGAPLWKKSGGNRWLYTGTDGKWYVGGMHSRRLNFLCSSGFVCSCRPHGGRTPDRIEGAWEAGDGRQWHTDCDILVTVLVETPAAHVAETSGHLIGQDDSPALYVITHSEAAVTADIRVMPPIIAHLSAGTVVYVVEVVTCTRERRVRGRIEYPSGWISLVSLDDGYRWAEKAGQHSLKGHECGMDLAHSARFNTKRDISEYSTDQGSSASGTADDAVPSSGYTPPSSAGDCSSSIGGPVAGTPPESPREGVSANMLPRSPSSAGSSEAPLGPQVLHVITPRGQHACAGDYELVPKMAPNGMPLWKQKGGDHWMYSGKARRWCIGGQDVIEHRFNTSAGWLYQVEDHGGHTPDKSPGGWMRWNGRDFEADDAIRVLPQSLAGLMAPQPVMPAVQACAWTEDAEADDAQAVAEWNRAALQRASRLPADRHRGTVLDVVLECIHADGIDIMALEMWQRCIAQTVVAGCPWACGPAYQPEIFHNLMHPGVPFSEELLVICWQPPCLHLQRPHPSAMLLVNGHILESPTAPLEHDFEVSACAHGDIRAAPLCTFRVLCDRNVVHSLVPLLQEAAPAPGRSILDLRGSRLSLEDRRAMNNSRAEALRIVI
mmetsp:Transcript_22169/g.61382  ORF Transcript_22169/g.61382 Transcript_22169/m.61382 type:complete len:1225 (-) Transcript_22169:123-3797(-)